MAQRNGPAALRIYNKAVSILFLVLHFDPDNPRLVCVSMCFLCMLADSNATMPLIISRANGHISHYKRDLEIISFAEIWQYG